MIPLYAGGVIIARSGLVAGFADPTPEAADRLMLCRSRKLHLIHGVLLAEELATFSAIDVAVHTTQSCLANGVRASTILSISLPVIPRDRLVRIDRTGWRILWCCAAGSVSIDRRPLFI